MKRVLFFIESLQCGGAEKSLLSLLNVFDYTKYDVKLVLLRKGGEFERLLPEPIKIDFVSYKVGFLERLKFKCFKIIDNRNKYHRAQLFWQSVKDKIPIVDTQYDIAISWGQGFATYFVAEKVTATKKYAWVNTDYVKAGYCWKRDVSIYNKFDKIIGISDFVKEVMQKLFPNNKVIAIRNIIDPDEIKIRANESKHITFDPSEINIVSVGRLVKYKGFELLIDACEILVKKGHDVHFYIIGEGPERDFLLDQIKMNALEKHCTLLGFNENPYPYINDCDIYVQSSWMEGLGRTVIEASILCKPIVTTDFPTAFSIITNEKTGLITEKNASSIAIAIEKIIFDEKLKELLIFNLSNQEDKEKEKTLLEVYELFDF